MKKITFTLNSGRCGFSLCFDNVNQRTTVRHQTRNAKNKMFYMVQGYTADSVPTHHLNDDLPLPESIKTISLENYLLIYMDEVNLRFEFTTIVHWSLCEYVAIFKLLANAINWHIQYRYSDVSASKSLMVSLDFAFSFIKICKHILEIELRKIHSIAGPKLVIWIRTKADL